MLQSVAFAGRLFRSIAAAKPRRFLFGFFVLALLSVASPATALTTFTITDGTTDGGDANKGDCTCADAQMPAKCTLRAAIQEANACPTVGETYSFTFAVPTVNVINGSLDTLTAPATITGPVTINGMGNAFKHGCLSFSDVQTASHTDGATNSQVIGLNISNCSGDAITANGHGFIFTGNTLHDNVGNGLSLSSSRTYGNFVNAAALQTLFDNFPAFPVSGTDVNNFAQQLATVLVTLNPSTVSGNFIFSNGGDGVQLFSENLGAVFISGNFIGTDPTGEIALGNTGAGVRLIGDTFGNMIGPGNVIAANGDGIRVDDPLVYLPNFIMGNRIGLPSLTNGTHIGNLGSGIATDTKPDSDVTHKNPSGLSLVIGPGNFISDNQGAANSNDPDLLPTGGAGVFITGASSGVKVVGNTIGMAEIPAGTAIQSKAYGNAADGVIVTSSGNTVQGNTIAGNKRHGIIVQGNATNGTSVLGNTIGLYPAFPNNKTLGNGFDGIHIDSASATAVGGPNQGDGNTIVANGRNGVALRGGGSSNGWGNLIQGDTIYGNAVGNPAALPNPLPAGSGLGIDLNYNLSTPDGTHPDCASCANLGQNTPYVCTGGGSDPAACSGASAPSATNGQTTLSWTISTHGPADFRAEFFKINTTDDNTASGITLLGTQLFSTDATAALTGSGCSNGRCVVTLPADASGAHVLMNVTDITQLTDIGSIIDDWKKGLICFLGLTQCPVNDTSEFSNVADVPLSNNANLGNLTISVGTLTPAFDSNTITYTDSVSNATTSLTVTPTVAENHATIKVNNVTVASGAASGAISLAVGSGNTINVVVTAQDGTTQKTYTVTVTRAGSSNANLSNLTISAGILTPAFASGTLAYTDSVSNATTSVTVTPTTSDATATVTVNTVAVTSGSASGSLALAVGNGNVISVVVTAQDGTTQKTYTVTVTRAASSNADLSNLAISAGILTPGFASNTLAYTDSVANAVASVTVTPTAADAGATIKVNTITVASGAASGSIALAVGNGNVISVVVTAADNTTTKTYTVTVDRAGAASNNASLSNLTISSGTLTPGFASNTLAYTDSVTNATASVTVTPTAADAGATIKVNNVSVASGAASGSIGLVVGNGNVISVAVTAADNTTVLTYAITVNRASAASNNASLSNLTISAGALTPAFASNTLAYADSVTNATASVTVTPTAADAGATIKVNTVTVASGAASGAIALVVGNGNTITVDVTAADNTTVQTYVVTVNRAGAASNNASLSDLTISSGMLMPGFSSNTLAYTDAVANATASVTVTPTAADAGATIKVNTITVASGTASGVIPLIVGNGNVINVVVTAADTTTTQTYTVTVNRAGAASNNALLSNLTISSGTLTPAFAINTLAYTDAVTNATASVTVTPTAADAGATIKVNNVTVASGAASGAIALVVGNGNVINVVVPAADTTTTQTYAITVNRAGAASNNAGLSGLTISAGTLAPAFAPSTLAYTDAVANATASVTVTPTAADAGATIKVNTVTVASGAASGAIALVVGNGNVINVVVTAADLTTTQSYTITVNRAGVLSNNAALGNLTISSGTLVPAFAANTLSYADAVSNATASVTVTPTAVDAGATIKVNTIPVASGAASGALALAVGPNPVNVVVTAADGTTTQAYLLVVTRANAAAPTQVSGMSFTGTGTITATISGGGAGCGFGSYMFVGPPVAPPAGAVFPDGLFQFTATGCTGTVTVTATFPTPFGAGEQYWKYGATPGPVAAHWYTLGAANSLSLIGNTATFTVNDGGLGDDDLAINSSITDAGGPSAQAPRGGGGGGNVNPAPSLSTWGLIALAGLLALFALLADPGRRTKLTVGRQRDRR